MIREHRSAARQKAPASALPQVAGEDGNQIRAGYKTDQLAIFHHRHALLVAIGQELHHFAKVGTASCC